MSRCALNEWGFFGNIDAALEDSRIRDRLCQESSKMYADRSLIIELAVLIVTAVAVPVALSAPATLVQNDYGPCSPLPLWPWPSPSFYHTSNAR